MLRPSGVSSASGAELGRVGQRLLRPRHRAGRNCRRLPVPQGDGAGFIQQQHVTRRPRPQLARPLVANDIRAQHPAHAGDRQWR